MKCSKCGAEAEKNNLICLRCGSLLNAELEQIEISKNKFSYSKKLGTMIVFIIIFLTIIGYNFINQYIISNRITPIDEITYNSFNYVNNLYKSDHRHYKYLLDDNQKEIYINLLNAIKNYEPSIIVEKDKIKSKYLSEYLVKVYDALSLDHPELIQFSTISYYNNIYDYNTIKIVYTMPKENLDSAINEFQSIIDRIKDETMSLTDYEKVKYIYDYLSENNKYDTTNNNMNQSAYSAISDKYNPVCAGYGKASQILLQNVGIDSIITVGTINSTAHVWNLVKLDNNYYYFDTTSSDYEDLELKYSGFLKKRANYRYLYKEVIPKVKNVYEK